jgi:hypothetical protein
LTSGRSREPHVEGGPKIITVSGARSGSGKTRAVERLLKALPDATAVKVEPQGSSKVTVREETSASENPSKDTGRYLAAGAQRAFLLRGPRDELPAAARRLCRQAGTAVIVFETNSLVTALRPDLALFVEGIGPRKPGAEQCRDRADIIVSAMTDRTKEEPAR